MAEKTGDKKLEVVRPFGDAEIEAHAAKVGGKRNLREVVVETDDGYAFHYLVKKPSRSVIQAVVQYEGKKDVTAQQKVMLGCVLEGDKEAYENDGSIYGELVGKIGELTRSAKADIKKI
ncbi:hypothetical protein EI546_06560 [Aequorivita sp. H23M31]|uniref:Uncharacterized protein n=1 Tax=Aequorivita ciconiae TaxID=2494375 RepID=A0A410G2E6_9FLAO|nr:hypothetical protein [Aequorivita sp. H23M31]QAA81411.1 hypothetical protein EI546_06560 [Aequorivita sp. H23M31]